MISVITAALSKDLGFALEAHASLCEQDVAWEWLLEVDGRRRPLPSELGDDPRVRVNWSRYRLRPGEKRNRALARSRGQMVQNLDVDDQLLPGALPALSRALNEHSEAAFAFGRAVDLRPDGSRLSFPPTFPPGMVETGAIVARWKFDPDEYWVPIHPAGVMWRREVLLALGGWTALWSIDDTALLMAAATLFPAVAIDADTFLYRKREGQLSNSRFHRERRGEQVSFVLERVRALTALRDSSGPAVTLRTSGAEGPKPVAQPGPTASGLR